ncbi:MAG: AMP-binding protein [Oscillospiraceae bacterium]|jgi:phenylacetate-coenzyme A ligase PaaK-like adenylate-forming protein|nr:AMP-binding protein [Oscillospiraceae bacterium]
MARDIAITPLDGWIKEKISRDGRGAADLRAYQLERLRATLELVTHNSRFYAAHLRGTAADDMRDLDSLARLPFTTPEMLAGRSADFMCVPPGGIARITTLPTSGTTGAPKRLCFTREDIELTVDFFSCGMSTLASPGERVMIFMPGDTRYSVGALLREALGRLGCEGIVHGAILDPAAAARALRDTGCTCAVGAPSQLYETACLASGARGIRLESVLLSADYASRAVASGIERTWGCAVFDHYGMTEMGFGGGVECLARGGYHMREADMIFEIIDPYTGAPAGSGEYGEVVFTTLTRRGMPLIRYRTGDRSRSIPLPCPCGTALGRLERVSGRIRDAVRLRSGSTLSIEQLDDIVYRDRSVAAYSAELVSRNGGDCLSLTVRAASPAAGFSADSLADAIISAETLNALFASGELTLETTPGNPQVAPSGAIKRRIADRRD